VIFAIFWPGHTKGPDTKLDRFKRWYPKQGLSSYEYANTIERWNKILLQISRK